MPENTIDDNTLANLLPIYYKRLFPIYNMCKWLGYSEIQKENFHRREFSFTLKDDIYLRYQTFSDYNEFEKELLRKCPYKIDIGGIYNQIPKDSKNWTQGVLTVEERELVFDIDITDYDDVRYCCSGSGICNKCWPLMHFAIKILDKALEDDFGFEHRLWIYSGRRGIHCWIADETARKLTSQARYAIAEYLTVVKGGENVAKKVNLGYNLHPSLRRASKIISKGFEDYTYEFGDKMRAGKTSSERWKLFQSHLQKFTSKKVKLSQNLTEEIMFQYCYPRLDIEVTKGLNHLLKSPFCVHPKTGRVCVPIEPEKSEFFDPLNVPVIDELCAQLERSDMINIDKKIKDYKKTDMKAYMEVFEKFILKLESTWKGINLKQSGIKLIKLINFFF
ncbi:DNA primase small subunit-like [Brachionus plicatilis]|uniref:DNA primase n=1 Tax=Brachionus plicatilis TaxID=10195 RepID=A0A3M7PWD2_BRAPC|nr:DNA primase small subunit-like [Brachionus plicatilis]